MSEPEQIKALDLLAKAECLGTNNYPPTRDEEILLIPKGLAKVQGDRVILTDAGLQRLSLSVVSDVRQARCRDSSVTWLDRLRGWGNALAERFL